MARSVLTFRGLDGPQEEHIGDLRAAIQPRAWLDVSRAALMAAGTPLLVFPFAWAAWVAAILSVYYRLLTPSMALRFGSERPLRVRQETLLVDKRAFPLRELREGWLEPWRGGLVMVLRFRFQRVMVAVASAEQGTQLLASLGVGPEQRVLRVPLGSRAVLSGQGAVFHLLGPVLTGLMSLGPLLALVESIQKAIRTGQGWSDAAVFGGVLLALLPIALGMAWMIVPGEAIVGRDGVLLRRLWNRRFFPFHQIKSILATEHGVRLDTTQGEIQLPTATFISNDDGQRDALNQRLRTAMLSWAGAQGAETGALPTRRGHTVSSWREELLRQVRGGNYREEGLDLGELVRALEDVATPLEQRVGAAMILGASPLESPVRVRVQSVIKATAHEPTRRALQGALEGDIDDSLLASALEAEQELRRATF